MERLGFLFTGLGKKVEFGIVTWACSAFYDFTTAQTCTGFPGALETAKVVAVSRQSALAATLALYLGLF